MAGQGEEEEEGVEEVAVAVEQPVVVGGSLVGGGLELMRKWPP